MEPVWRFSPWQRGGSQIGGAAYERVTGESSAGVISEGLQLARVSEQTADRMSLAADVLLIVVDIKHARSIAAKLEASGSKVRVVHGSRDWSQLEFGEFANDSATRFIDDIPHPSNTPRSLVPKKRVVYRELTAAQRRAYDGAGDIRVGGRRSALVWS